MTISLSSQTLFNTFPKLSHLTLVWYNQAQGQKFTMGGGCVGDLGEKLAEAGGIGEKPPDAGGTEVWGRSPQRSQILHFFANIT